MASKNFLNEIMGVPTAIDPWVKSITKLILTRLNKEISNGWDYSSNFNYDDPETGENIEGEIYKTDDIEIDGKDLMDFVMKDNGFSDMKDFIKSEMFTQLPIWRPELTFRALGLPPKMIEKEKSVIQASVGLEIDKKLAKLGKLEVISGLEFDFQIAMENDGISSKTSKELEETVSHEILHTYQKYRQLTTGGGVHFGRETALNAIANNSFFKDVGIDWWNDFLHLIYLHLSFEINARVTQLYYQLKDKDIKTSEEFVKELHSSYLWDEMKRLENFDAKDYINKFKLPQEEEGFTNPLAFLHNIMIKKHYQSFGVDTDSDDKSIKSLIELWDTILNMGVEAMRNSGVNISMERVPNKAKEDPYVFFKFFEDRFHKKAETWKRKMYKIGSLILNERQ